MTAAVPRFPQGEVRVRERVPLWSELVTVGSNYNIYIYMHNVALSCTLNENDVRHGSLRKRKQRLRCFSTIDGAPCLSVLSVSTVRRSSHARLQQIQSQ